MYLIEPTAPALKLSLICFLSPAGKNLRATMNRVHSCARPAPSSS
jgi:hypothetical protein